MLYKILRALLKTYFNLFFKWKVAGQYNIPENRPVILVANHISNYDPLVLACAIKRKVHYMAKEELFKVDFLGRLIKSLGAFPIKRGGNDRQAIRAGFKVLVDGEVLGVFPEGTRSKSGKLGKGLPGAAMFALKSDAVVIPVGIRSTYTFFSPIYVNIGKPISLEQYKSNKISSDDLNQAIEYIMDQIRLLLEVKVK